MANKQQPMEDERAPERKSDLEAQLDELGTDPSQVGERSAGQSGGCRNFFPRLKMPAMNPWKS